MALPLLLGGSMSWLFIGVAALLMWLAIYYLLGKPLADLVRGVPIVGRDLANAILGGLGMVSNWALGWAQSAVFTVVELLSVPVRVVHDAIQWAALTVDTIAAAINKVAQVAAGQVGTLARRVNTAIGQIGTLAGRVAAAAAAAASGISLANWLRSVFIPQQRAAAVSQSAGYTNTRVAAETTARGRAIDDVRVATGRAIDGEAGARARADQALAGAAAATAAELARKIAAAEAGARGYTNTQVGSVSQQLAHLRDVALPTAVAGALAATATVAQNLAQVRTRCVDPMCGTWGRQVSLVQALMSGAELALVMALVGQAVRDPEGTAAGMAGAADLMHGMGSALLSPIIGRQA